MKIGFVVDDTLDKPDGVQQYVLTLGSWLQKQGHDVHYFVGESYRTDLNNVHSLSKNVRVRFNKNRLSIPLPASKNKIRTLLQKENYDVLHVQMPHSPLLAAKVVKLASPSTAIIGTFHIAPFSSIETTATRALGVLLKRNLRYFDQIISVSTAAQNFAKQTFKINSIVLPNVVDLASFKVKIKKAEPKTITFLGRLVPRKGCQHLLHAISMLDQKYPDTKYFLRICGDGPDRGKLWNLRQKLAILDNFKFTGKVSEEDKKEYLADSHIAVFPSTGGESFGIVLIEAMAAGSTIVLGGNNSGYKTVLGDVPESIFDPQDYDTFADKLNKFLTDEKLTKEIHQKQQELVRQYDVAVVGPKLVNLYKEAIAKKSREHHN